MKKSRIYDVTLPLYPRMPVYPGDPEFKRTMFKSMAQGAGSDLSLLTMGAHTGTHVDAPKHILPGRGGIDTLPLEVLVGPCLVCAIKTRDLIEVRHLRACRLSGVFRILFKTGNSRFVHKRPFRQNYVTLSVDAARYLVDRGIRLVGVDYFSVDKPHSGTHPVHQVLLRGNVVIIEGANLYAVPPGRYELFCGPLKIEDGDGAPARVLLKCDVRTSKYKLRAGKEKT
jgi:arylformamidase